MDIFTQQTEVLEIDDKNSITVTGFSWGERQKLMLESARKAGGDPTVANVLLETAAGYKAIHSWSGPMFGNRSVTPENIDLLPPGLMVKVSEVSGRLSSAPDDAEKKASGTLTKS